jgi:hypothetical protein
VNSTSCYFGLGSNDLTKKLFDALAPTAAIVPHALQAVLVYTGPHTRAGPRISKREAEKLDSSPDKNTEAKANDDAHLD